MIAKIFLGKAWHWALLVLTGVLFWFCGTKRLHVIEFNLFVMAMLAGTTLVVGAIILFHQPGEQITREVLVPSNDGDDNSATLDRA